MPKKVSFNLSLSAGLLTVLFAGAAFAQTSPCPMSLETVEDKNGTQIEGAAATAVSAQTKRLYKSILKDGMPYFAKLPDGEYRVTISKPGYKRSVGDVMQDCAETGSTSFLIELYKGDSRQTVNFNDQTVEVETNVPPTSGAETPDAVFDDEPPSKYEEDPKAIRGGVLNGKATDLVKPAYPAAARAVKASGAVNVQVTIDEEGNVISAAAISGHPLLRAAAVQAARQSKFAPTRLSGQPVKVTGIIVYNFVP